MILDGLSICEGSFCFKDQNSAKIFTDNFWCLDTEQWTNKKTAIMFNYSGLLLKKIIDKGYLSKEDLFAKNDKEIIEFFHEKAKEDREVKELLDVLYLPIDAFDYSSENYESHLYLKVRRVNPNVLIDGELKRYSELDKEYAEKYSKAPKYVEWHLSLKK